MYTKKDFRKSEAQWKRGQAVKSKRDRFWAERKRKANPKERRK